MNREHWRELEEYKAGGEKRTEKEDWHHVEFELLPNVPQSEPQQITLLLATIWKKISRI